MLRVRRLVQLWNWLPTFRVVGESAHLPTASRELGVTAPALSRSIKLLEQELGQPLFRRVGRRIELNEAGEQLLSVVRDAMRGIDDGLTRITGDELTGAVRVAALAHHSWMLCRPAFRRLKAAHPGLVPCVYATDGEAAAEGLRTGSLDAAIASDPRPHRDLVVEPLVEVSHGLYVGAEHPLYRARRVPLERALQFEFVAPVEGVDDGWPPHLVRRVGAHVSAFQDAVALCSDGAFVALLPDAVGREPLHGGSLRRLPVDVVAPAQVYLSYRRPVAHHPRTEALVEAVRGAAADLA